MPLKTKGSAKRKGTTAISTNITDEKKSVTKTKFLRNPSQSTTSETKFDAGMAAIESERRARMRGIGVNPDTKRLIPFKKRPDGSGPFTDTEINRGYRKLK